MAKTYTQELVERFVHQGQVRIANLSEHQLTHVIFWLETKAMEARMVLGGVDDALEAAKLRGGIEALSMAAAELMLVVEERVAAAKREQETEEDEG